MNRVLLNISMAALILVLVHSAAHAFSLPDNGQAKCYDATGNVLSACTGTGQGEDKFFTGNVRAEQVVSLVNFVRLMHVSGPGNTYPTFYDAYAAAGDTDTIQAQAVFSTEALTFADSIDIFLTGGYDSGFDEPPSGFTTVGSLEVSNGTVVVSNMIISGNGLSIAYNGNGSSGGSVPVDATNYQQGQSVTVLGNPGNLVKTGYDFTGWNTQADGFGTTYTPGNSFTMGSANVTLYAMWRYLSNGYNVTIIPPQYHLGGALSGNAGAYDLNDSGIVIGGLDVDPNGATLPFVWDATNGVRLLTLPTNYSGVAISINNAGLILGVDSAPYSSTFKIFTATAGASLATNDGGMPEGAISVSPFTVTASGQLIVKAQTINLGGHVVVGCYVKQNGAFTNIGLLAHSVCVTAGKSGFAYGYDVSEEQAVDSFVWNGTTTTKTTDNIFVSINNAPVLLTGTKSVGPNGEILSTRRSDDKAIIYRFGGVTTDLGFAGSPKAMNASGAVVGTTGDRAFLWTPQGGFVDLNTQIDPALGLTLTGASGINSTGQIICGATSTLAPYKYVDVAVVLTPK
jgi:uncharacterized repeat protein (TIGR02543 family)